MINSIWIISIHTLRVEGDTVNKLRRIAIKISIHTLRVEGDQECSGGAHALHNFYPHPPCGG